MSSSPTEVRDVAEGTRTIEIAMPQMGISVAEGTIVEWRKRPGDWVEADEPVCDVSTDKVDVEIPSPAAGRLGRIVVEPGETVAVGAVLAELEAGMESRTIGRVSIHRSCEGWLPTKTSIWKRSRVMGSVDVCERRIYWPFSRKRKNRNYTPSLPISRSQSQENPSAFASRCHRCAGRSRSTWSRAGGRRRTAPRSPRSTSRGWPPAAASCAKAMDRRGVHLTYLAFVARATVAALGRHPILNASVEGEEIVHHEDVNLGIAVALEDGLIVPVIRRAQRLSLEGMAAAIGDVATRAREKRLQPDEVQGGTFTITNPGQFGTVLATPIINQPQVAILDLEAVVKRPVVIERDGDDSIAIRPMACLCLSFDHRALDGAEAARFLGELRNELEQGGNES